jgi:NAD(P)-dependent dehydrogenase (short-subunit alcohol dehydrogenase family)
MLSRRGVVVCLGTSVAVGSRWSRCETGEDRKRAYRLPGLTDKVAVVSGAAQGIGRATAIALADQGATVVIVDLPSQRANLAITEQCIRERCGGGAVVTVVTADATKREDIEAVFDQAEALHKRVDVSVGVVGGGDRLPFLEQVRGTAVSQRGSEQADRT